MISPNIPNLNHVHTLIETAVSRYVETEQFVDEFEMKEIQGNPNSTEA